MAKKRPSDIARDFFTSIKRAKEPAPIYYVYGEESYLLDRAVEALIKLAAPDGINDFNYDAYHAKEVAGEQLRSTVETLPFMSKRRIVLVRDLQEMDLRQLNALDDYFTNPSPSTCLILHAMTAQRSVDGRNASVKKLKKAAEVCEFKTFYAEDAERFVRKQAADRGLHVDQASIAYLTQAVGSSLADLSAALEKVDLFIGPGDPPRQATVDVVSEIIADTKVNSVFDLTDALGERNLERALIILDKMLLSGEAAIMINQMIARHFRIIAKLQDPSLRNAGRNERARAAGVSPFFLKDYNRHAAKFSPARTRAILERLVDVDLSLKSSKLDDRIHLERLICAIVI